MLTNIKQRNWVTNKRKKWKFWADTPRVVVLKNKTIKRKQNKRQCYSYSVTLEFPCRRELVFLKLIHSLPAMRTREKTLFVIQTLYKLNQLTSWKNSKLTKEFSAHKTKCSCKTLIDQRIIRTYKKALFHTAVKSKALLNSRKR